jgi:hypothetical protein
MDFTDLQDVVDWLLDLCGYHAVRRTPTESMTAAR